MKESRAESAACLSIFLDRFLYIPLGTGSLLRIQMHLNFEKLLLRLWIELSHTRQPSWVLSEIFQLYPYKRILCTIAC